MEEYAFEGFHCPRWRELPDLGLYMDQVLLVVEGALRPLFPNDPVVLTSTMVNNYVKQQVLTPSEKKKYGREHLAVLIAITVLKRVLSVAEIRAVLERLTRTSQPDRGYDRFCALLECRLADREGGEECDPLLAAAVDAVAGKLRFEARFAALCPPEPPAEKKKKKTPDEQGRD